MTTVDPPTIPRIFQPTSPESEPLWYTTPNVRSTFDLICSCVLTLIMCVWTAIHLNIPEYAERKKGSWWPHIWRRIWWMFLGLIAPELVLYSAWSQFIQARLICVRLRKIEEASVKKPLSRKSTSNLEKTKLPLGDEKKIPATVTIEDYQDDSEDDYYDIELARNITGASSSSTLLPQTTSDIESNPSRDKGASPTQPSRWERFKQAINPGGLERGFYAAMGGFEVVIGQEPESSTEGVRDIRRTVTPCGTIMLCRLGLLPPISIESINDKSKADVLTKGLVCIQSMWMLVQAAGRKIEGLPVTLLELNTIMHVVCALAMYILWLKKPQDVGLPTRIEDRHKSRPLGALLCIKCVSDHEPYLSGKAKLDECILQFNSGSFTYKAAASYHPEKIWGVNSAPHPATLPKTNRSGQVYPSTVPPIENGVKVDKFWIHSTKDHTSVTYLELRTNSYLTPQSARFVADYVTGAINTFGKTGATWETFCDELYHNGDFGLAEHAGNLFPEGDIKSDGSQYAGWTAAIIFPAIYGGIHLSPWKEHFPTHLERYLWRFSGLYVAAGVPGLLILYVIIESTLDTYNPFKIPFRAYKWVWKKAKAAPGTEEIDGSSEKQTSKKREWGFCEAIVLYPLVLLVSLIVWFVVAAFGIALLGMTVLYPLTRFYILVEAFASLRSLPVNSYRTVAWTEMWPHF